MTGPRTSRQPFAEWTARLASGGLLVLALAACTGAAPGTPEASATAVATVAPTPSATPVDLVDALVAWAEADPTFAADLSGTLQIGEVTVEVAGEVDTSVAGTRTLVRVNAPGIEDVEETLAIGGATYTRSDDGYWIRSTGAAAEADSLGALTAQLVDPDSLHVAGTEVVDGRTLQVIEHRDPPQIKPAMLGMLDPTISGFDAAVSFLARDDGEVAGILVDAGWEQGPESARTPATLAFRYDLVDRRPAVEVPAPEDVWLIHESTELHYRMAYPSEWDVVHQPAADGQDPYDHFIGPIEAEFLVYAYALPADVPANGLFRGSMDALRERFGAEAEVANQLTLTNGIESQIVVAEYEFLDDPGTFFFFQEAILYLPGRGWDIDWFSRTGNETEDQVMLLRVAESFEPLD